MSFKKNAGVQKNVLMFVTSKMSYLRHSFTSGIMKGGMQTSFGPSCMLTMFVFLIVGVV